MKLSPSSSLGPLWPCWSDCQFSHPDKGEHHGNDWRIYHVPPNHAEKLTITWAQRTKASQCWLICWTA